MKFAFILLIFPNLACAAGFGFFSSDFNQICHAEPISKNEAVTPAHCIVQLELCKLVKSQIIGPLIQDGMNTYFVNSILIHPGFRTRLSEGIHDDIALIGIDGEFSSFHEVAWTDQDEIEVPGSFKKSDSGRGHFIDGKLVGILSRSESPGRGIFTTLRMLF